MSDMALRATNIEKDIDRDILRPSLARLSRKNFRHNLKNIRGLLKKKTALHRADCGLMGVVKADAYGHTLDLIVPELRTQGVDFFAVASLEEAVMLRKIAKREKILVLGGSLCWSEKALQVVKKFNLQVAVNDRSSLEFFCKHPKIPIHLKLDTGMNRLGMKHPSWSDAIGLLKAKKRKIEGLFTHYATFQGAHFKHQVLVFEEAVRWFFAEGFRPSYIHSENSGALFSTQAFRKKGILSDLGNLARPGISMYGYLNQDCTGKNPLRPVLEFSSEVGLVKTLEKAEGVSYGLTYRASKREDIGVVPMGYADGLSKEYKEHLQPEWRSPSDRKKGRLKIAGTICMDMIMVRSLKDKIKVGDRVIFWGDFPNSLLDQEIVGPYELNCRLSKRIPRMWDS